MSQVKTTELEGDVAIGRHVTVGGNATVRGNANVKKNLRVEGWLDAPNVIGVNKGLFPNIEALRASYPYPEPGWYAMIGATLPAQLAIATKQRKWEMQTDSEGRPILTTGQSAMDITEIGYFPTEEALMEHLGERAVFANTTLTMATFTVGGTKDTPRYSGLLIQVFDRNISGNSGNSRMGQYIIRDGMKIWYRSIYAFGGSAPEINDWIINELNTVHFFARYDVVHSSQGKSDDRGNITLDTELARPGYITYLERDGVFVTNSYQGTWNTHWGNGDAFGKVTPKGVTPKTNTLYVCTDTGQEYTVVNGKLTPTVSRPERLRVLSWNVGGFGKGNSGSFMASGVPQYEEIRLGFAKMFNFIGADIIGLCEYRDTILTGKHFRNDLFGGYPHAALSTSFDEYRGKGIFAASAMRNVTEISLPGDCIALECEMHLGGRTFVVCMVHNPWAISDSGEDNNLKGIEQLCKRYKYVPRVLLMGDFNALRDNEAARWQRFRDVGFTMANQGAVGAILTSYSNVKCSNAIDNIMVKGATIARVGTVQFTPEDCDPDNPDISDELKWDAVNLSDHFPIFADVIF